MRRIWTWLIAMLLVLCIVPAAAQAAEVVAEGTCGAEGDNLTWVLTDDGVLTISGEGAMADWGAKNPPWHSYSSQITTIEIENGVTGIGSFAFAEYTGLTRVYIPASVSSIGEAALSGCGSLAEIIVDEENTYFSNDGFGVLFNKEKTDLIQAPGTLGDGYEIPSSVTSVGSYAFLGCTNLSSFSIPDNVTTIGFGAFGACTNLVSVEISHSATAISDATFFMCSSLSGVTIPDSVTSIGSLAFSQCVSLTELHIPKSVTSIAESAFDGCSSITAFFVDEDNPNYSSDASGVLFNKEKTKLILAPRGISGSYTVPGSITYIEDNAFAKCSKLTDVSISAGVQVIGTSAFSDCSSLASVAIADGVHTIKKSAFANCTNLTDVIIPGSVTTIGDNAFTKCTSLSSINIPDSVTYIGQNAFSYCSSLKEATLSTGLTAINYATFINCSSLTCISIPGNVTSIDSFAFSGCTNLSSVILSESLETIGQCAFQGCSSLTSIPIPNSVTAIESAAFQNCTSLTQIAIPDGVATIGSYAFRECSGLIGVDIPDGVTSIGEFTFYNCTNLTNVSIPGSVATIGKSAFWGCRSLTSVSISEGVTTIGASAFGYCDNLVSVDIPNSVTSIGESAFDTCTKLTNVRIPDGVTSIGDMAFRCCTALTSVNIPDSMTCIGNSVFSFCGNLTSVFIPTSVTSIGYGAFDRCSSLTELTIPDSVSSIGASAFSGCRSLVSISIPDSVTAIDSSTFMLCTGLTSVTLGDSVTSIGESAFSQCTNLTNVNIPDSVTSIGESAFSQCSSLTIVNIPDSVSSIGESAFFGCTSLTGIHVDDANADYSSDIAGVLFSKDLTLLIQAPGAISESYVIPDNVRTIGISAFSGCSNLTAVTIPNGVTTICESAFSGCSSITSVNIPTTVTSISWGVFSDCSSLLYVSIPDTVISIGPYAFSGCRSLTAISIPASVSSIGFYAFSGCTSLTEIHVDDDNPSYSSDAFGVLFSKDQTVLIQAPGAIGGSYVMPDGVVTIDTWAFYGCGNLASVTVSADVASIGYQAFQKCNSLTGIYVDKENQNYSSDTFGVLYNKDQTTLLQAPCAIDGSYLIPNGVTVIDSRAFYGCSSLTSVTIPASVSDIGYEAFAECTNMISAYFCGDAQGYYDTCFPELSLTVYYPAGNDTWVEVIETDSSGIITWIPYKYSITPDGSDTTASGGSDTVTFHCDGELNDFVGVQVDGETVDASNYTLTEGSTIVTLHADYLNTLSAGEHAVSIEFTDGFAYGSFYVTGDHEHSYTAAVIAPSCTEKGYTTHTCACGDSYTDSYTEPLGHDYVNGICSRCGEDEPAEAEVMRVAGTDRIETSMMLADQLKAVLGVTKFDSVIVASALNFPDALTGSYLAAVKNAPILLTYDAVNADVVSYITLNMDYDGTVYILGGESAVNMDFESRLKELDITYKRVAGSDRFGTNLEIMKEAGVTADQPVLIATALNFADSLSASAAGLPMVLVYGSLRPDQKEFLATTSKNFVIIGGEAAVSKSLENELKAIGSVNRLAGDGRYQTSVMVAQRFVPNPDAVVLAYARNFPDGLCGGPLAYALNAPLILTDNYDPSEADKYVDGITAGIVVGGSGLISDASTRAIFDLAADTEIPSQ